jgi:MYXO-CTERM domain-containing protein
MRSSLVAICITVTFAGCAAGEPPDATTTRVSGLTQSVPVGADTFINSAYPDNNNGESDSIYTGRSGMNGVMRGLVQFTMPAALQGRVTVTGVRLAMTTRGLSATGTSPPTAAIALLQAVGVPWTEGNGVGNAMTMNTVGDACGATGATWSQPNCAGGAAWSGGSVATSVSGQASVPAAIDAVVIWDSTIAGNGGMNADVQGWIDTPANNHGWRIASSTEATMAQAQRFYSSEAGAGAPPALTVTYGCKAGFSELGNGCTICTAAAMAACASGQQGNACTDPGPPSTSATCTCGNAAYVGTGTSACVDRNGLGGATGGSGGAGGGAGDSGTTGGCSCALAERTNPSAAIPLVVALLAMIRRRRPRR